MLFVLYCHPGRSLGAKHKRPTDGRWGEKANLAWADFAVQRVNDNESLRDAFINGSLHFGRDDRENIEQGTIKWIPASAGMTPVR